MEEEKKARLFKGGRQIFKKVRKNLALEVEIGNELDRANNFILDIFLHFLFFSNI